MATSIYNRADLGPFGVDGLFTGKFNDPLAAPAIDVGPHKPRRKAEIRPSKRQIRITKPRKGNPKRVTTVKRG